MRCAIKTETGIKTEENTEVTSVIEKVNPALLEANVIIGDTDPMPLLGAVDFLDDKRCDIRTETGTGTTKEEGASTSGEINIGSAANDNVNSGSTTFGSGEVDFGDSVSITVASGNAQQQSGSIAMASSSIKRRVIMP